MGVLTEDDLDLAGRVVRDELAVRVARASTGRPGQALAAELFDLIVSQSLLPILVAVTSTHLTNLLHDRKVNRMKKSEAQRAARNLIGKQLVPADPIDPAVRDELRGLLAPLGLAEQDIEALIDLVRQQIDARHRRP